MYNVKDIKIIPYVRFRTPDGAIHDTMEEALAHKPPHCKLGQYAMWCFQEGRYNRTDLPREASLVFISNHDGVAEFKEDFDWEEVDVNGVSHPGWYVWVCPENQWTPIPDNVGEILVGE